VSGVPQKKQCLALFLFACIILGGGGYNFMGMNRDEANEVSRYLPEEMNGWRAEGKDEAYNPETIFDYIDGAGEAYRSYNFQSLLARRYLKRGQPTHLGVSDASRIELIKLGWQDGILI
jgi:hypothetical protein